MLKLILIVIIQLLFVPMLSLRTICMVKNLKILTAVFGFMEAIIYIFGLAIVLSGEQSVLEMVVYALGFSLGLLVGTTLEEKMAIGYSCFHVNVNHKSEELSKVLRDSGFGVTQFEGYGKDGYRFKLEVLTKRKRERELISAVLKYEPNAFIMSIEPKMFKGGYLSEIMKKRFNLRKKQTQKVKQDDETGFLEKSVQEIKEEVEDFKNNWKF